MANQMIALQSRGPQLTDPSKLTAQYANMMNMAAQQRASQLQGERTRQEMEYAKAAEGRAVAGEDRAAQKFSLEQSTALVSALGTGLVGILRDPSDATIGQVGQTFASVGMDPEKFGPLLKQIQEIPDANDRKLFALQFISQSEPARGALKYVMPEVKETKVGDATVFTDQNPNSPNFGQELFRFTVAPEPVKLNQSVVGSTVMNTNPVTGVTSEATIGDPTQGANLPAREPSFASTGVRSPYAVGAGTGQQPMMPPAAAPAQAVGIPVGGSRGAPGAGGNTFSRMIQQESRGKQFDRNGRPLTSSAGAIGIAQVMPGTAPEAAKLAGLPFDQNRYRTDEAYNLALGKAYYEKQLRDFGDERLAAAAYNAGPGAVRSALKKGGPNGWINHVPAETRKYVRSVFGGAATPTGGAGTPTSGAGTPTGAPKTVSQALTEKEKARTFSKFVDVTGFDFKSGKDPVADLIKKSTGGGAEKLGADIMAFIPESMGGGGTKGMDAISALNVITSDLILTLVPEGKLSAGVSNEDRKLYERLVGDINNPALTRSARLSAWNQLKTRMSRLGGVTMPKAATPTGGSQGKGKSGLPRVTTDAQWNALKSGQEYIAPNGERKRKR